MGFMGYRKRTGFLAGLTVAQISEFSIVFVAMGITLGHVGTPALGLTTLVGLVTITASTYLILYSQPLYERLAPWLGVFERRHAFREAAGEAGRGDDAPAEAIVFGLGRYGGRLLRRLSESGVRAIGVDFDPEAVRALQADGLPARFGDGEDPEFLATLPLAHVRWVITTFPQWDSNRALLHALRAARYGGEVAGAVRDPVHRDALHRAGVALVLQPFDDAADRAAEVLARTMRAGAAQVPAAAGSA
jgi:hypothetical protein